MAYEKENTADRTGKHFVPAREYCGPGRYLGEDPKSKGTFGASGAPKSSYKSGKGDEAIKG